MKTKTFWMMAWAALFMCASAQAQTFDDTPPPDAATPPRLALTQGDVQFWRPGSEAWEPAQINAAMAEGDAIDTGGDATVELQTGSSGYVRLTADTQLTLEQNTLTAQQFRLIEGTASIDLRGSSGQVVRIDTKNANIAVAEPGYYRIQVGANETRLTVRNNGRASMTFIGGNNRSVSAGEEIVAAGARIDAHAAPATDAWDDWNEARSQYYAKSASYNYVSQDVYGAADLDNYGSWSQDSSYGAIWTPVVTTSWTPYSQGYWRSDPFYGWTWIDSQPWGWTTSHYGRWVRVRNAWAWAPGPRHVRVAYAPALVALFEGGGGMSWVSLSWGEPLRPWWGSPSFRGSIWWGGWYGPRVTYQPTGFIYRNTVITRSVVSVRMVDFGHRPVRGSNVVISAKDRRPVYGNIPVRYVPPKPVERHVIPPRAQPRREAPRGNVALPPPNRPQGGRPAITSPNRPQQGGRPSAAPPNRPPQGERPSAAPPNRPPQGGAPNSQSPRGNPSPPRATPPNQSRPAPPARSESAQQTRPPSPPRSETSRPPSPAPRNNFTPASSARPQSQPASRPQPTSRPQPAAKPPAPQRTSAPRAEPAPRASAPAPRPTGENRSRETPRSRESRSDK
ncbi:MAG: FecR domain-containing protein [Gallionellaceae bacterium]|jgi:hypothetical protein|nr:FecR domain-containing protein [Gallionellaceae bacterium]